MTLDFGQTLIGQFADKPNRGQSSRGLVNLLTCLTEKFAVNNCSKCDI